MMNFAKVLTVLPFLFFAPLSHAETLNLDSYRGKVVYLDFWASWCEPCRESFPWLNRLHEKASLKDAVIIGVNLDQEKAEAEKFLKAIPAKFQIVYDPAGELAKKFDVQGMPYAVIIGRDGKVAFHHIGFRKENTADYEREIEKALAVKAEVKP